jgi:hypothetical protein
MTKSRHFGTAVKHLTHNMAEKTVQNNTGCSKYRPTAEDECVRRPRQNYSILSCNVETGKLRENAMGWSRKRLKKNAEALCQHIFKCQRKTLEKVRFNIFNLEVKKDKNMTWV